MQWQNKRSLDKVGLILINVKKLKAFFELCGNEHEWPGQVEAWYMAGHDQTGPLKAPRQQYVNCRRGVLLLAD